MISARATYDGGRFLNRYRVPLAGKIDAVLFDKTGTLTSDKLAPVSVVNSGAPLHGGAPREESPGESRVCDAGVGAAIVLAGCHSLISIDGNKELLGDPIETAALAGVQARRDHTVHSISARLTYRGGHFCCCSGRSTMRVRRRGPAPRPPLMLPSRRPRRSSTRRPQRRRRRRRRRQTRTTPPPPAAPPPPPR